MCRHGASKNYNCWGGFSVASTAAFFFFASGLAPLTTHICVKDRETSAIEPTSPKFGNWFSINFERSKKKHARVSPPQKKNHTSCERREKKKMAKRYMIMFNDLKEHEANSEATMSELVCEKKIWKFLKNFFFSSKASLHSQKRCNKRWTVMRFENWATKCRDMWWILRKQSKKCAKRQMKIHGVYFT